MKAWASSLSLLHAKRHHSHSTHRGFTIVELLIVIVVIAILAAITIVTYNGVQQRANNAAIIDAASKSRRMIQAYIATNGTYPPGGGCITAVSGCQVNGSIINTSGAFDTAMATIGSLPRSIPMGSSTNQSGILYSYSATRTYEGNVQPVLLYFWLYGVGQSCGVPGVTSASWTAAVASSTGYTAANDNSTGKTLCYVTIPGPSA